MGPAQGKRARLRLVGGHTALFRFISGLKAFFPQMRWGGCAQAFRSNINNTLLSAVEMVLEARSSSVYYMLS